MQANDRDLLELATAHYRHEGNRVNEIRARFDMSVARFWQRISTLIDDPATIAAHPSLVLPLRRQREQQGRLKRAG